MKTKKSWEVTRVHAMDLEYSLNKIQKDGLVIFQILEHGTNGAFYNIVSYKEIEEIEELEIGENNW